MYPKMASIEEIYEKSFEADPLSSPKYDARDHFMLMPERRKQLKKEAARRVLEKRMKSQERRAAILSVLIGDAPICLQTQYWLTKGTTVGSLDRLNNDCLIQIMQQIRNLSDLRSLLVVSSRCRGIWEAVQRPVLVGIQRKHFPEYLEMFGDIGAQSDEQLENLRCAIESESYRWEGKCDEIPECDELPDPEETFLMKHRETDVRLYERSLLGYLQHLDDFFNDQVERLHAMGVFSRSSHRTTKYALLALWRIGWMRPLANGLFKPAYDAESIGRPIKDQAEEVQIRMRDIIHLLSCKKEFGIGRMSIRGEEWVQDLQLTGQSYHQLDDRREWMDRAINATVLMRILVRGTDNVIDSRRNTIDKKGITYLDEVCISRSIFDETGAEDKFWIGFEGYMNVAQQLGVNSLDVSRGFEVL